MKMNCLDSLSCFRIKILLSPDKNPFTFKIVTKVTKFFNIYNRVTNVFWLFSLILSFRSVFAHISPPTCNVCVTKSTAPQPIFMCMAVDSQ